MTTTEITNKLNRLNNLYAESQKRELGNEETAEMQKLYDEVSAIEGMGMQASPKDGQYFYIEN